MKTIRSKTPLDYRFASAVQPGALAVMLDPDVAKVFKNAETVNDVLRALITTIPGSGIRANQ